MADFIRASDLAKQLDAESRVIIHVDLDAFFAMCEEVRNPKLRGKPVVIGADPRKGRGRGVVSTANYTAREYGIKSAMPISVAYRRCKWAVFIKPDFNFYTQISKSIFKRFSKYGERFEQAGIDEAYLDVSSKGFNNALKIARQMQVELKEKEGLTCSIGIAPNKMIAKIGSDFRKPNGITLIKSHEIEMFLSPLDVGKIPGIGPKTQAKLYRLGVRRVDDLLKLPGEMLKEKFGANFGAWLFRKSRGIGSISIGDFSERKSLGAERTFYHDEKDTERVYGKINELCDKVFSRLNEKNLTARIAVLKIRYADFETHTSQKSFKEKIESSSELKKIIGLLSSPFLETRKKIRLVGVMLSGLEKSQPTDSEKNMVFQNRKV